MEQKDQLTLINSLKQINDKIKFRALIIGEGEEKNKLNQEIKKKQTNRQSKNDRISKQHLPLHQKN